jgi:hypothetical protein
MIEPSYAALRAAGPSPTAMIFVGHFAAAAEIFESPVFRARGH